MIIRPRKNYPLYSHLAKQQQQGKGNEIETKRRSRGAKGQSSHPFGSTHKSAFTCKFRYKQQRRTASDENKRSPLLIVDRNCNATANKTGKNASPPSNHCQFLSTPWQYIFYIDDALKSAVTNEERQKRQNVSPNRTTTTKGFHFFKSSTTIKAISRAK